jgi:transcriptional regulator with XRE-family HTH domain
MMSLGQRLRIFRATHQLSQVELAAQLGISQSALSLMENNKAAKQIDADNLKRIATFLTSSKP